MRDDVVDGVVAIFQRHPKIAVQQIAKVASVLFPNRFVEVVFGLEVALDFWRGGLAVTVERPARCKMNKEESQRADDEQQRDREQDSSQEIHHGLALIFRKVRNGC